MGKKLGESVRIFLDNDVISAKIGVLIKKIERESKRSYSAIRR